MKLDTRKVVNLKNEYPKLMEHCQDISAGDGWFDQIETVLKYIARKYPDKDIAVTCIKEKFGHLRIYYSALGLSNEESDDIMEVVSLAESVSMSTCEACGKKGQRRVMKSWVKTLCDQCDEDNL